MSVFLASVMACSIILASNATAFAAKVKVKKIQVNNLTKKTLYLTKGKSKKLKATVKVTPNKAKYKKVTFKSSNKKVATVSSKGVVKAKKAGTAKITVTSKTNKSKKTKFTVKVTNPVKSVKLNRTSASLFTGSKLTLKATLSPAKDVLKTLKWTSSNNSVASVSSNGVVTAKRAGKTTITAASTDGTNKKASCTVTVKNRGVQVDSASIYNPGNNEYCSRIAVNLSQAKALTKNDFTVQVKRFANGQYNHTLDIDYISTSNNKNYVLTTENTLYAGNYYRVSVKGMSGVSTKEFFFKPKSKDNKITVTGTVGQEMEEDLYFDNTLGYTSVKVTSGTLPAGLTLDKNDVITGKPTAVANNSKVVFSATDELGTVSRCTVNFVIGNETTLYAENKTIGDDENKYYTYTYGSFYIEAEGGSGRYDMTLVNDYNGIFSLDNENESSRYARVYINSRKLTTAGKYSVQVKFTDKNNSNLTAIGTVNLVVTPTVSVTNVINNMPTNYRPYIYYLNKDTGEVFCSDEYANNATIVNAPTGNYEVYTYDRFDSRIMLNNSQSITVSTTLTFNLPNSYKLSGSVTDNAGKAITYNCSVYLTKSDDEYGDDRIYSEVRDGQYSFTDIPAGKYTLEAKCNNSWEDEYVTVYKAEVTIADKDVVQNISIDPVKLTAPETIANLTEPGTVSVTTKSGYVYIAFTPKETGYYSIYSEGEYDTKGILCTATGEEITSNDDNYYNGDENFKMIRQLEAGTTYYIGAKKYSGSAGYTFDVIIEKTTEDEYYNYYDYYEEW